MTHDSFAAGDVAQDIPQAITVNAMPAATWGWLKMNDAQAAVPAHLASAPNAARLEVEVNGKAVNPARDADAFERALDAAAARYALAQRLGAGDAAQQSSRQSATPEKALDATALSSYQGGALDLERTYTPARAFKTGMGHEGFGYLSEVSGGPHLIAAPAHASVCATLHVCGTPGAAAVGAVDVVASEGSNVSITIALDSPDEGEGIVGSAVRVLAGKGARVSIACIQTLADGYTALDDTGMFLAEGAQASVRHDVLGAGASFTGLSADLRGDESRASVDVNYLGARSQTRDFNYEITHRGRNTESNISANGVLAGESKKCLRGTIDLTHGCKGSQGTEHETVLLADERVRNKSVPVILCDEDEVAGNHGATIGHIRADQLLYLTCRGISEDAAEELFIRAKLEDAAIAAPGRAARAGIVSLGKRMFDDFEESLGEEIA